MKGWKFIWLCFKAAYDGFHVGIVVYTVFNLYSASQNSSEYSLLSSINQLLVLAAEFSRYLVIIFTIAFTEIKYRKTGAPTVYCKLPIQNNIISHEISRTRPLVLACTTPIF